MISQHNICCGVTKFTAIREQEEVNWLEKTNSKGRWEEGSKRNREEEQEKEEEVVELEEEKQEGKDEDEDED